MYIEPQTNVYQEFSNLPAGVQAQLSTFVFGPNYRLFRYSDASERALIGIGEYAAGTYAYPSAPVGAVIDTAYVKLFLESVVAKYATMASGLNVDPADPVRIYADSAVFASSGAYVRSGIFKSRDVQVGDVINYTVDGESGTTQVAALEHGLSAAAVDVAAAALANAPDQTADVLAPKASDNEPEVVSAAGNARAFDGALTGLYAITADNVAIARLADGALSERVTVTITTAGAAGTAKVRVTSHDALVSISDVPVVALPNGLAGIYLTGGLWMQLDEGDGEDGIFHVGDVYSMSTAALATWSGIDASDVTAGGEYAGAVDTVYSVRVSRGGRITRSVTAFDGLAVPSQLVVTVAGSGTMEIDGVTATAATVNAAITAVNAMAQPVYAVAGETGTIVVTGPADLLRVASFGTGWSLASSAIAKLVASVDFDAWLGGNTDDEYILKCTAGGQMTAARFSLDSLTGDSQSVVAFGAAVDGVTPAVDVGVNGLSLAFDTNDSDYEGVATTPVFGAGDFWVIRVNAARPVITISDSAGSDAGSVVTLTEAEQELVIGSHGVTAEFDAGVTVFATGDVFHIPVTAAASGPLNVIVVADALPATGSEPLAVEAEFCLQALSAQVDSRRVWAPPAFNWTADADGITVNAGIAIQVAAFANGDGTLPWLPVQSADMYAEYRALLTDYAYSITGIDSAASVALELGSADADNPLAEAVALALANSGGRTVYFSAIPTDDVDGYAAALLLAEQSALVYHLYPATTDEAVCELVASHVAQMSDELAKRWRIAFFGLVAPTVIDVLTSATNPDELDYAATITADGVVDFAAASGLVGVVRPGDTFRYGFTSDAWGAAQYSVVAVETVVSNTRLTLTDYTGGAVEVPSKIEIVRTATTQAKAEAVAARAAAFASRRIYAVYPAASTAAIAGLASSVAPQRPITNISVTGVSAVETQQYSRTQLNLMAGAGVLLVVQDAGVGAPYVRHQVSTAAADSNVYTTELSVTRNVDAVSYYVSEALSPYRGRYNITPELLRVMETQCADALSYLSSDQVGADLVGPMLIGGENTGVRSASQHPTLRDHSVIVADIEVPVPHNVAQIRLVI